MPHENDRSVIAAAIAVRATIICTNNLKHFPAAVLARFNMVALSADDLFTHLIFDHMTEMVAAHEMIVAHLTHGTDQSTITALHQAGAPRTADLMAGLLGLSDVSR